MGKITTPAEAEAAARDLYARVERVRVTLLLGDGTEVFHEEYAARPGDTLTYQLPLPGEVEVTVT